MLSNLGIRFNCQKIMVLNNVSLFMKTSTNIGIPAQQAQLSR